MPLPKQVLRSDGENTLLVMERILRVNFQIDWGGEGSRWLKVLKLPSKS